MTQTKGTGEAHPFLSPNDEFANFEIWDKGNLDGSTAKTKDMLEYEYARSGLKIGLALEQSLGVNPYRFGLIGSSDAHTGLTAMDEDNFFGKTTPQEPSPERMHKRVRRQQDDRREDHGLGSRRVRLRRGVGDREHARSAVRRDGAARSVRNDGPAHDRAVLRRVELHGRRRPLAVSGGSRATAKACRWAVC